MVSERGRVRARSLTSDHSDEQRTTDRMTKAHSDQDSASPPSTTSRLGERSHNKPTVKGADTHTERKYVSFKVIYKVPIGQGSETWQLTLQAPPTWFWV
ncbi:hypothetical protein SK128_023302 [Halocaridina rubra]|uniref:Uncharacterized protein n=1 Tax=Halocaridina rubra TaxID=373956 RepID=A0AAN8WL15_HALRR